MSVEKFIEAISLPAQVRVCPAVYTREMSCLTNITRSISRVQRIPRAKRLYGRGNLRYTFALAVNFLSNCGAAWPLAWVLMESLGAG